MIITPQALRGIYTAFNTVFNKAFEGQHPTYEKVATRAQHQRIRDLRMAR